MPRILDPERSRDVYARVVEILEKVGVIFSSEDSRKLFAAHGAKTRGETVFIPAKLLELALSLLPDCEFDPARPKKVAATSPFGNVQTLYDEQRQVFRRGTLEDAVKMYRLTQTSALYECANPAIVDPLGNDAPDPYVGQIAVLLRYTDKWISSGMRATAANAKDANLYESQRAAIRLIKQVYDKWDEPLMTQGICPMSPLKYDPECLHNLKATAEEGQRVSLFPCSLTNITGPTGIFELVIHDLAISLAGIVYVQLLRPGLEVSVCPCSAVTDMKTLQPCYGAAETAYISMMIHDFCKAYKINCTLCGTMSDSAAVNYQAGAESFMSTLAPFYISELDTLWCWTGHLSAWYCGSFEKLVYDEELMRNVNRLLRGAELVVDDNFLDILRTGRDEGTFLSPRTRKAYRRDYYISEIFSKYGVAPDMSPEKTDIRIRAQAEINRRLERYQEPDLTRTQKQILQAHLPSPCKY